MAMPDNLFKQALWAGRRQIAGQGFLEQIALLSGEGFVAHTEAHAAQGDAIGQPCG